MTWETFWHTVLLSACGVGALLYVAILMLDPYDSIWFSPPLDRAPIAANQRFSYPALARDPGFDGVAIGTSTIRLLKSAKLNQELGGHFANLSMNNATAYEQAQIFQLFARHHPAPRNVIVGIDVVWCKVGETFQKFTPRPFPPWLYDEDPWNDLLHVFNIPTVEQAGRLAGYLLGLRAARFGKDGYADFLPPRSEYDLARARDLLYGEAEPRPRAPVAPAMTFGPAARQAWTYPSHPLLRDMLSAVPAATRKILVFVPYHHFSQPAAGSREFARWRECKTRLTQMASEFENSHVVDFMIHSRITLRDENYWDPLHYDHETAERVGDLIGHAVRERCGLEGLMDYLYIADSGELRRRRCPATGAAP